MVLQNKYKARASRRYNAARGGVSDGRGRGRGRGQTHRYTDQAFPSLPGQGPEDEDGAGDEEEAGDSDDSEAQRQRAKYAPRSMASNAWRFEEPGSDAKGEEGAPTNEDGHESSPEPEIDLSGLMERVAKLDSSRTSKALTSEEAAKAVLGKDADDIDVTLLHLLDRQRQRQAGSGAAEAEEYDDVSRHALTGEQRKEMEREGKRLLEEKARQEKHDRRARVLQQSAKSISLDIGPSRRSDSATKAETKETRAKTQKPLSRSGSHLYDDEEEYSKESQRAALHDDNDAESFLDEMSSVGRKPSEVVKVQQTVKLPFQAPPPENKPQDGTQDEDFLDSIL